MKVKDLMYKQSTGEILITSAKEDGKIYQGYLMNGYFKIGTISGFDMIVKGLTINVDEHNEICDKAIKQVVKDVENEDIDILGDWFNKLPTPFLKLLIS
jgi:hypothetical protein